MPFRLRVRSVLLIDPAKPERVTTLIDGTVLPLSRIMIKLCIDTPRRRDKRRDLAVIFLARRAFDPGGDIDPRRAGAGERLRHIVRRRGRPPAARAFCVSTPSSKRQSKRLPLPPGRLVAFWGLASNSK